MTSKINRYFLKSILQGRLAHRILFWVIAISSFFALLTTCFQLYITFEEDKAGIQDNLEFIKNSYVPSISSISYALEENTLTLLMQGVLSIQDITYLEVWESQSKWLSMGNTDSGNDIIREYPLEYTNRKGKTLTFGKLVVTASLQGVYQRLWRRAFVMLGTNIIKTVFTSICIFFIFQWMVTRHLSTIAAYSSNLDFDCLSAELKLERVVAKVDEFDDLTKSINEMRGRLIRIIAEQKRLISIIENTTDIILTTTPDSIIKYMNVAGLQLLGWDSGDDYIGKKIAEIHPAWSFAIIENTAIPYAIRHGVWVGETTLLNKEGKEIPTSQVIMAHKSQDGALEYLSTIIRDISDLRHTEEELKIMEKAIAASNSAIVICDPDGILTYVNRSFLSLWGYDSEYEILGRPTMEFWQKPEELRQLMNELLDSNVWLGEMTAFRKDNTTFLAQVSAAAVKNEKGELVCLMSSSLDITAKHEMETQLRQAYKMEAIGTLAGGIAHDFNNILTAIFGYAEIAQMKISGNPQAEGAIQQVLKASNRAKDLVAHILTFSRSSEMGHIPVEIGLIVKEALQLLRASIPTTIEIQSDIDSNCGAIIADPTQIHQVMMNLCTNSAHAMEDNGGVLKVSLKLVDLPNDEIVKEPNLKPGTYICLSISDTGPGIDPAIIGRIFDPYFTTKEVGKGSGMGLAVVQGIVKSHDGIINVTSELGKRTAFHVFFARAEKETPKEDEDQTNLATGSEHILVVDDENAIVEINRTILEGLGYKITSRTSSTEALDLFRINSDEFDLVLTDYTMPNLTGESLAKEMLKIKPGIPIILYTGYNSKIDSDKAKLTGIKAFAMKPLSPTNLSELIRNVLDES